MRGDPSSPANPRLLLVDDIPDIVEELVTMFDLRGIPAIGASSVGEAMDRLREFASIELVASDIRLNDEEGEDLLALSAEESSLQSRNLRFLFMTGDVMRFGQDDHLEGHPLLLKPVPPQLLLDKVFGLLRREGSG